MYAIKAVKGVDEKKMFLSQKTNLSYLFTFLALVIVSLYHNISLLISTEAMFPEIARAYSPDYEIFMRSTGYVRKYYGITSRTWRLRVNDRELKSAIFF